MGIKLSYIILKFIIILYFFSFTFDFEMVKVIWEVWQLNSCEIIGISIKFMVGNTKGPLVIYTRHPKKITLILALVIPIIDFKVVSTYEQADKNSLEMVQQIKKLPEIIFNIHFIQAPAQAQNLFSI